MSTLNRDFDDVLRRALHAAAETVEPSPDGLERIRARMSTPPALSFASAVAWCHEAASMFAAWAAPLIRTALDAFWSVIDRFRPATPAPGESGPRYAWIRPVAAMGTAIFVVAAGAFAILTLPHAISANNRSAFSSWPWTHTGAPRGGGNGGLSGHSSSKITGSTAPSGSAGVSTPVTSPASSQCSSLGTSRTGSQGSTPPILTQSSSPPAIDSSPPVSTTPTTTPTPTPTPTATPDPGAANTPTPTTSSQAATDQTATASESQSPQDAAIVPTATPTASSSVSPCATKKKKTSQRAASSGLSAFGALQFRITEDAAKHD